MRLSDIFWCLGHQIENCTFTVRNNRQTILFCNPITWTYNAEFKYIILVIKWNNLLSLTGLLKMLVNFPLGGGVGSRPRLTDWHPLTNGKTSPVTVRNFQWSNFAKSPFEKGQLGIYIYINILILHMDPWKWIPTTDRSYSE